MEVSEVQYNINSIKRNSKFKSFDFCCRYKSASGVNEAMVVVGLHQRSEPDNFTVRVPVSDIIINHKFNRPGKMLTSDIMLLKLAHPVEFNDAVSPICLPSLFEALSSGKRCYTSGWGRLSSKFC